MCSPEGTWVQQPACVTPTPRCLATTGQCVCKENDTRCDASGVPQICDALGQWVSQAACPTATTCAGGSCVCPGNVPCCTNNVATVCVNGVCGSQTCALGCGLLQCNVNTVSVAGKIACNYAQDLYCNSSTEVCFFTAPPSLFRCGAPGTMTLPPSSNVSSTLACDGPGDCPVGQVCCKGDYQLCDSFCASAGMCGATSCAGVPDYQMCDPAAPDCPSGKTCSYVLTSLAPATLPTWYGCK